MAKRKLYLKPAEVDHGIKFKRIDIDSNNIVKASYKNVKFQFFVLE